MNVLDGQHSSLPTVLRGSSRRYVWLIASVPFLLLSNGRWAVAIAAYLAPLLLLGFLRRAEGWRDWGLAFLVQAGALALIFRGMFQLPQPLYTIFFAAISAAQLLPYVVDRWARDRLSPFQASLAFPAVWVVIEYASAFAPSATWGNVAYTQATDMPLVQAASLFGLGGISFLVLWFAPAANDFVQKRGHRALVAWAAVALAAHVFGGLRLAVPDHETPTVRLASVTVPLGGAAAAFETVDRKPGTSDLTPPRTAIAELDDQLLALTRREARAGAKVVFWSEGNGVAFRGEEGELVARAQGLAREEKVALGVTLALVTRGDSIIGNELLLITPTGEIAARYAKAHPAPGEPVKAGDGPPALMQLPWGMLGAVICFDADFPSYVRKAAEADVLIVPSADWVEIDPFHTEMAMFRAVENGQALVRQTRHGLSAAFDNRGRELARMDDFTANPKVMTAEVPARRAFTLYSVIGDLFVWACIPLLALLAGIGARTRRR